MASLKALKNRIASVKSTQKITKAMKMVAAAKLRRAQQAAEAARPYAERMEAVMAEPRRPGSRSAPQSPKLLAGTGKDQTHLLIVSHLGPRPRRRASTPTSSAPPARRPRR